MVGKMYPRIALGKFLIRLGRFVSSLALMVMRPNDLVELSRRTYATPKAVKDFASDKVLTKGLTPAEKTVLEKINLKQGRVLVLGVGGGRDAIALAKKGFAVTGIDYIPAMIEMTREKAAKHGVEIEARVGDFANLDIPGGTFDVVWLAWSMYSSIPTRRKRLETLKRIHETLKLEGWFVCGFHWVPIPGFSPQVDRIRKIFAYLSMGNLWYEPGDMLMGEMEFLHGFRDEDELAAEFAEGGFELIHLHIPQGQDGQGLALLYKGSAKTTNDMGT